MEADEEEKPVKIKCQHCGYEWWTQSTLEHVTCPSCSKKTKNYKLEEVSE